MEALPPSPHVPPAGLPKVVFWFRVYTGCMTTLYVLCILAAPVVLFAGTRTAGEHGVVLKIEAVFLLLVGVVLAAAFALPFVLPRKRWVWVYDLVLICIGMTSCCILPAAVPLLIYWVKPETKDWFSLV